MNKSWQVLTYDCFVFITMVIEYWLYFK